MSCFLRISGLLLLGLSPLYLSAQQVVVVEEEEAPLWPFMEKPESTDETSSILMGLNLKARGGREELQSVRTVRFQGTLIEGKIDYALTVLHRSPASVRLERYRYHIGKDYLKVWGSNGTQLWTQLVQPEKKLPSSLGGLAGQQLDFQARLPFLFLDPAAEGHVFAYKGEEKFAGRASYVIHGWLASGMEIEINIDTRSFHVINYRIPFELGGEKFLVDHTPTRLKREQGIWWEIAYRTHIRNRSFRQIRYDSVELDVQPEDGVFAEPPVKEVWIRGRQ